MLLAIDPVGDLNDSGDMGSFHLLALLGQILDGDPEARKRLKESQWEFHP